MITDAGGGIGRAHALLFARDGARVVTHDSKGPTFLATRPDDGDELFEVTRDKKVVWAFKDFKTFGNGLAAAQVLGIKGKVTR